ncbi:GP179 protein, partial [Heliornis fulica]|nr:GP179 protein [Heliornis fulica]
CPWESTDTELSPQTPSARSPVLPKPPSRPSQSAESLKAEVCPWEAPAADARGRAEICPWEVAVLLPEKGAVPGETRVPPIKASSSGALREGSSEREAVCPWESRGTEQPSPGTAAGKEPT